MAQDLPALPNSKDLKQRTWFWVAFPISAILLGHWIIDTLSAAVPTLFGVVEKQYGMAPESAAILLGMGSICSGLAQPVFAWISDRWNTRVFGAVGILLGSLGIGLIGQALNMSMVFILYAIGMMGIGMFHPIAASTIGHLAGDKRGLALSWFFVFGMAGFVTGSLAAPALATGEGGSLHKLSWFLVPGIVLAILVQLAIGKLEHRAKHAKLEAKNVSLGRYDWVSLTYLYVSCVFRFFVNMAIVYLIVRWMEADVALNHPEWKPEKVSDFAAPLVGRANATMFVGQGIGGMLAGALIKMGHEKVPLVWTPILLSPALVVMAFCAPSFLGYAAIFCTGIGFAAMTPVAMSVGQRLMPYHTSLASGIMLGGAWVFASLGPITAEYLNNEFGLKTALIATGVALALAGISAMGLKQSSMKMKNHI